MTALTLKLIACITMLIDHVGFMLNFMPFRIIGRLAFPIFLYLIYNGYRHTSSPLRYALRLGVFALISQVPFSRFCYGVLWSSHGNVCVTLLMALLCVWAADAMGKHRMLKWISLLPAAVIFLLYHFHVLSSDYGAVAILAVMVFYLFHENKVLMTAGYLLAVFYRPLLALALGLLRGVPDPIPAVSQWEWIQGFSGFALPLICSYNGEKGNMPAGKAGKKLAQYGFYTFYPVHMLLLTMIWPLL